MSDTTDEKDTSKTNTSQNDSTENKEGEKNTQQTDAQKAEQERIDKIVSDRLKREREKSQKDFDEKLKRELEERDRLAKLSAEEKEAEERKRQAEQNSAREREITLRENRADAREILQEKKISTELVDFVVDVDAEKTKANIDNLEKAFLKAVETGVNDRMKGKTPEDKSTNSTHEAPKTGTRVL